MRAISHGNIYDIYDDTLKTYDKLPAQTYIVRFSQNRGFYIESIEQDVMVLFDEFDKTFGEVKSKDGDASPQSHLLSLFDGLSGGKKMFVITCNELRKLNDYLINRPGRFHYHFRFEYPSADEIRDYLQDKLEPEQYGEIENVISFSSKISLNYDCLRAIAFELKNGYEFKDAIKDLNIVNVTREEYNVILKYKNGLSAKSRYAHIDMFDSDSTERIYLYDNRGRNYVDVEFTPMDAVYDMHRGVHIILPGQLKLIYDDGDGENTDIVTAAKATEVDCLMISRKGSKMIHYAV